MRAASATFVRNWLVTLRAYQWSFFIGGLLTGGLTVALAYFMFHLLAGGQVGAQFARYAGAADYMSYVILGAAAFLFSVRLLMGIARSLITERREGTFESLLLAPAQRASYFAGVLAQFAVVSVFELAVMLLLAWPLGLRFGGVQPLTLLLTVPVALVGLLGMALCLGAVMLALGDTYISQNTLFSAMALVCGFTFPPQYLPAPLQAIGNTLPVTGALRLLRAALLDGAAPMAVAGDLALYALLGLAFIGVGLIALRRAERRALEGSV
jgi:ABC-2 type transport system permease protein